MKGSEQNCIASHRRRDDLNPVEQTGFRYAPVQPGQIPFSYFIYLLTVFHAQTPFHKGNHLKAQSNKSDEQKPQTINIKYFKCSMVVTTHYSTDLEIYKQTEQHLYNLSRVKYRDHC